MGATEAECEVLIRHLSKSTRGLGVGFDIMEVDGDFVIAVVSREGPIAFDLSSFPDWRQTPWNETELRGHRCSVVKQ